jgi:hypothetical protein
MAIAIAITVLFALIVIGLSFWIFSKNAGQAFAAAILVVLTIGCWIYFASWLFILWTILLFFAVLWFEEAGTTGKWISAVLALIIVVVGIFLVNPSVKAKTSAVPSVKVSFVSPIVVSTGNTETSTISTTTVVKPATAATPTAVATKAPYAMDPNAIVFGYNNSALNVDICASLNTLPVDPASIPWPKTDRELNKNISEKLTGPAVIEWWYGGSLEGVWRLAEGESMTLPVGTAGHYFPQTSNEAMMFSWPLEVCNYSKKVEHVHKLHYGDLVINPLDAIVVPYSLH